MRLTRKFRDEHDLLHINRVESINSTNASLTIGWQVRFHRKSGYHSKLFSDGAYGGKEGALAAARRYRNQVLQGRNEDLGEVIAQRMYVLPELPKNNKSGILGVNRSSSRERSGKLVYVWQSTYREASGRVRSNSYRIHRHGEIGALIAAIRFRRDGVAAIASAVESSSALEGIKDQIESYDRLVSFLKSAHQDELEAITACLAREDVPPTSKKRFVESRITQKQFRDSVRQYCNNRCVITGSSQLLIASHIKPWSACTDPERMDPYNGLLLSATYDRAFDLGLITFDRRGVISVSSSFLEDARLLGINGCATVDGYSELHERYMRFHRANIFRK